MNNILHLQLFFNCEGDYINTYHMVYRIINIYDVNKNTSFKKIKIAICDTIKYLLNKRHYKPTNDLKIIINIITFIIKNFSQKSIDKMYND